MSGGRPLGAALGIVADRLFGEPPISPHPVAAFGTAMKTFEEHFYADERRRGAWHAGVAVGIGVVAGLSVRSTAVATYLTVAGRELGDAAVEISSALRDGDLDRARDLLPNLVGRDPDGLDENEIARAVVESVAENTVDAVVAPALWAALAGAPGAFGHRSVNTIDAMVGHHSDRYEDYGWASARLDDAVAWIPARTTAVLVAAARPRRAAAVMRTVARDAGRHPSPNAGVAEAAFAAALGLRLGGENRYGDRTEQRPPLGDGRAPGTADIEPAVRLSVDVAKILAGALAAVGIGLAERDRRIRRQQRASR